MEVETIQLNVRETDAVESSVLAAVKKFGRIDVAVNVAGSELFSMRNMFRAKDAAVRNNC